MQQKKRSKLSRIVNGSDQFGYGYIVDIPCTSIVGKVHGTSSAISVSPPITNIFKHKERKIGTSLLPSSPTYRSMQSVLPLYMHEIFQKALFIA